MTYTQNPADLVPLLTREERKTILVMAESRDPAVRRMAMRQTVYLARLHRRRDQDHERDRRTRVLIGARLPRDVAARVESAAMLRGVSVYRWVSDAIIAALERESMPPGSSGSRR